MRVNYGSLALVLLMLIISAVGPDRPGMAHAVAQVLFTAGCNIEDTTMTRLSGEFAMILIVTPPAGATRDQIAALLAPVEVSHGLFISCRAIDVEPETEAQVLPRYMVSVYGPEAAGLLARVTGVLASQGANITDVQTRVASAGQVYIMLFEIELASETALEPLQAALQAAASSDGLQVSVRILEAETL